MKNWKAVLGIPEKNKHKRCPIIPEFLWLVMENPRSDCLDDGGMFQSYIRLLRKNRLVSNSTLFYGRCYYYSLTAKSKAVLKRHEHGD